MKKAIIFDSSTLITFSMNGLTNELKELKKTFDGDFIITSEVKREIIDKPLTIKRFELEALRLKQLLDEGVFKLPSQIGIDTQDILSEANKFLDIANNSFYSSKRDIHLISLGEATCLGLGKILSKKGVKNALAVDERTTRMLGEKPENLKRLFEKKLHTRITSKNENFKSFEGFNFIRSSELVYVMYKKNIFKIKDKLLLEALLWAVKFKGCSISGDEIREIQNIR